MTKSRYSRPSASHTRHPAARDTRAGTSGPASGPKSASGRLLPVDVKPGTRQSLTVFHHLDGHRAEQLDLPQVERRAVRELPHRSHDPFGVARLEEVDRGERP